MELVIPTQGGGNWLAGLMHKLKCRDLLIIG